MIHFLANGADAALWARSVPLVSVIVVNVNGRSYLARCIDSVRCNRYPDWELIVVDNGSSDGTPALVREISRDDPRVRLVALERNLGPAAARNAGARQALGSIFAFLDNDTVVTPDWLIGIVSALGPDPGVGACQCKLLLERHPDQIDYVGDYLGQFGFLVQRADHGTGDRGQFDQRVEIFTAKSAAMGIRREAFEVAGGFDPDYFIYVEETDLGWRTWLQGYRIVFAPDSVVFHAFGTSRVILGQHQLYLLRFHGAKNYVATLFKNLGTAAAWRIIPLHIALWVGLAAYQIAVGRPKQGLFIVEGLWWCWTHRHQLLLKRRDIQQRRKISDDRLLPIIMRRRGLGYFLCKARTQAG